MKEEGFEPSNLDEEATMPRHVHLATLAPLCHSSTKGFSFERTKRKIYGAPAGNQTQIIRLEGGSFIH